MERVIVIDKCQDCKYDGCTIKTMCGPIPAECPLVTANTIDIDVNIKSLAKFVEKFNSDILGL